MNRDPDVLVQHMREHEEPCGRLAMGSERLRTKPSRYTLILWSVGDKAAIAFFADQPKDSCPYKRSDLRREWQRVWDKCAEES